MHALLFFVFAQILYVASSVNIRILEGVDRMSTVDDTSIPYVVPAPRSGPESLSFLSGACFTNSFDRYEYTVCPFQNVTQRRNSAVKPVLVGLWGHWRTLQSPLHTEKGEKTKPKSRYGDVSPTTETAPVEPSAAATVPESDARYYNIMEFTHGRNCGVDGDSTATIYLQCEHSGFEVISLDSESTCAYSLTLGLPIACNLLKAVK